MLQYTVHVISLRIAKQILERPQTVYYHWSQKMYENLDAQVSVWNLIANFDSQAKLLSALAS